MEDDNWPYDNPASLNYDCIDEGVRKLCRSINNTDWLRTAESCSGHPKGRYAWSKSTYLRLITNDVNRLFDIVDAFDEGSGPVSCLCVQYDRRYPFGVGFYVTFPQPPDIETRDIYIDFFLRELIALSPPSPATARQSR